ncbi:protein nrt1/ ptr family 5.10 [Phtheirospermum japonicum]|uniref:Protein nrt1/ ptr family 5.10 n=1 Tax=Phtheirospermum japonicum TaxID=374723 RepID=A0A830BAF2_9LAMI|nr:protein nrt1/ ptr family 5.10 [Phtheirospermum japonicum]
MTISVGDEISEAEMPLLNDVVPGSVDFKGRTSVRSKSGCWKSSSFIIGTVDWSGGEICLLWNKFESGDLFNRKAGTTNRHGGVYAERVGLSFLSLSASLRSIDSSKCKPITNNTGCAPDQLQLTFFFFSLYLVALAQGGLTPCVQAFGADQFDEEDEDECKAKSSFFNWWYCFASGGILVPLLVLTYIQENVSWELGFGIPAIVMCLTLILFLFGCPTYRFRVNTDGRNPFVRINQVFVEAAKNWRADPVDVSSEEEGFLPRSGSQLDITDVEDAKSILRLAPIWCACLGYSIVYAQPSALFTKQVGTIDRHITATFQIPAASLQQCFITTTIMFGLPLYDRVFVPIARSITKIPSGISMLHRISFGLLLSFVSIAFAAFVERKRLLTAREHGLEDMPWAVIPMSIWWFAPQYVLAGIADVFAMVGLQEFFYDQVPSELKSIGLAMYLSILGIGSLLSSFLVSSIQNATRVNGSGGWFSDNLNRAHLDYFYWLLAGISATGFLAFIFSTRSYLYRRKIVL